MSKLNESQSKYMEDLGFKPRQPSFRAMYIREGLTHKGLTLLAREQGGGGWGGLGTSYPLGRCYFVVVVALSHVCVTLKTNLSCSFVQ